MSAPDPAGYVTRDEFDRTMAAQKAQFDALVLSIFGPPHTKEDAPSVLLIQREVALHFRIKFEDMTSRARPEYIACPRQIAMYFVKMFTSLNYREIGREFGGRDHGTVMFACRAVETMIEREPVMKLSINALRETLAQKLT